MGVKGKKMSNPIQITNVAGGFIKAVVTIPYKGYEIVITGLTRLPEIVIYDAENNLQSGFDSTCDGDNLLAAFKFIDAKTDDKFNAFIVAHESMHALLGGSSKVNNEAIRPASSNS